MSSLLRTPFVRLLQETQKKKSDIADKRSARKDSVVAGSLLSPPADQSKSSSVASPSQEHSAVELRPELDPASGEVCSEASSVKNAASPEQSAVSPRASPPVSPPTKGTGRSKPRALAEADAEMKAQRAAMKAQRDLEVAKAENKSKKRKQELAEIQAKQEQARAIRNGERPALVEEPTEVTEGEAALVKQQVLELELEQEKGELAQLLEVVHSLVKPPPPQGGGCPWTATQTSRSLLTFLQSEVAECEVELALVERGEKRGEPDPKATRRLHQELGDLAFDCLLLVALCRRDHPAPLQNDGPYQLAAHKIKERTPYMAWGTGEETAKDATEAEAHWQRVKRQQKARKAASGDLPESGYSGGSVVKLAKGMLVLGGIGGLLRYFEVYRHPKVAPAVKAVFGWCGWPSPC